MFNLVPGTGRDFIGKVDLEKVECTSCGGIQMLTARESFYALDITTLALSTTYHTSGTIDQALVRGGMFEWDVYWTCRLGGGSLMFERGMLLCISF